MPVDAAVGARCFITAEQFFAKVALTCSLQAAYGFELEGVSVYQCLLLVQNLALRMTYNISINRLPRLDPASKMMKVEGPSPEMKDPARHRQLVGAISGPAVDACQTQAVL